MQANPKKPYFCFPAMFATRSASLYAVCSKLARVGHLRITRRVDALGEQEICV